MSAAHRKKPEQKFLGAHPPTPAPAHESEQCQSKAASNDNKRYTHERGVACSRSPVEAESELRRAGDDLKVVEWIEFKPRRGTRSTKLNRSNWSSDDLKEKRNVADRTVAVALSWCAPL